MASRSKLIKPTELRWFSETINWEVFQRICLHLYIKVYNDHFAEEYLQRGMFQDGIDIISFKKDTGKSATIQCKHYRELNLSELKKIVALFLASGFLNTSDLFIVTTTAILQEAALKKYIFEQIAFFRNTYAIQFDCWDVGRLETELKNQYLLVEHYFGVDEADRFCFEPGFRKIAYQAVDGFINRSLKDMKAPLEAYPWVFGDRNAPKISLASLFSGGEEKRRLVGIIGEAYEGKSTLFRQTAFDLYSSPDAVPLLLDLKGCVIQPLENLLDINFNTWKSIPAKNLVVLVDSLDEVATEDLLDAIAHIKNFGTKHPSIRIGISCRKLYYSNYNLDKELPQFAFFELTELHYGQIIRYADGKTSGKGEIFYKAMDQKGVSLLLANPFYLIKLVGWHINPKENIPETKVDIALKLIEESFNISGNRKPVKGRLLTHYKTHLKKLLQQLALAFQINGMNSCDDELIQELFAHDDTILLKNSSVLDMEKGKWMFTNAFFQEQLAAMALKHYPVDDIIGLLTVGKQIRKIKTKWIQTISTYLSMFVDGDENRTKLLAVIENDNIELIAKSEGSKFSPEFKLGILQKVIARSVSLQSRLVLISENELATFIGNEKSAVNYLLNVIREKTANVTKVVCCHILKYIRLNQQQVSAYTELAESELLVTGEKYYGRLLLETISHYRTGNKEFIEELIDRTALLNEHEFRQGVYKYLEAHHLVEDFYDFVLEGLNVLYAHNTSITHSGSEIRILALLLETTRADQLKKLLIIIAGDRFHTFFRFKSDDMTVFLTKLQDRLIVAYEQDQTILAPVVDCVVSFGLKRVDDEFKGMNLFFEKTNTYRAALEIYLEKPNADRRVYDFSDHVTRDCFEYLIAVCRSEKISRYELDSFINGLSYTGRYAEAEELQKLAWKAFGKPDDNIKRTDNLYAKAAVKKAENDVKYISSAADFEKGIKLFFKTFKKNKITYDELYNRENKLTKFLDVSSDFVIQLMHIVADERTISLERCLEEIRDDLKFRVFRVNALLNHHLGKKYAEEFVAMIRKYYLSTVAIFQFDLVNNDSSIELKVLANQYLKIWSKFAFETPDEVLLEFVRMNGEGLNFIRIAEVNKRESVGLQLVQHFEGNGNTNMLRDRILLNLQKGFANQNVLGTHIELCRKLHIVEALPQILKVIYEDVQPYGNDYAIIDIFVELGGDLADLMPLFEGIENFEDYTFIHLAKILRIKFLEEVIVRLLLALKSPDINSEKKLEVARLLAELGNKDGFRYIIAQLNPQLETPYHIQSNWIIWNVDTTFGLELLEPLVFTLVDDTLPKFQFQSTVDHLILEILNGFAAKSEADLKLVLNLLDRKANEYKTVYPLRFGQLLWYAQQMQESFRKAPSNDMAIAPLKAFLARILN